MARAARSPGYLERLIAGAGGGSAARAPYRRAWGPAATSVVERRGATAAGASSATSVRDEGVSPQRAARTGPLAPSTAEPAEHSERRRPAAQPPAETSLAAPAAKRRIEPDPSASSARAQARNEAHQTRPVAPARRRTADDAARPPAAARRSAPGTPPTDARRAATPVTAAPPQRTTTAHAVVRNERRPDQVRPVAEATPARAAVPVRSARPAAAACLRPGAGAPPRPDRHHRRPRRRSAGPASATATGSDRGEPERTVEQAGPRVRAGAGVSGCSISRS